MCAFLDCFARHQEKRRARTKNRKTDAPADPPAIARTCACVRDVDAAGVCVEVGEDLGLTVRAVVLDEDDDEVVEELELGDDVESDDRLEVVGLDVTDANAAGKSWPSGHPVPSPWQGSVRQQP